MNPLKQLPRFPRFALGVGLGVINSVLTEAETFLLAVGATFVGLWLGASVGLATFLLIFILLRFAGQFVGAIARELHFVGAVLRDREFEVSIKHEQPVIETRSIFPSLHDPVHPLPQDSLGD